jgi:hypothetical protein
MFEGNKRIKAKQRLFKMREEYSLDVTIERNVKSKRNVRQG